MAFIGPFATHWTHFNDKSALLIIQSLTRHVFRSSYTNSLLKNGPYVSVRPSFTPSKKKYDTILLL
jgi:hypothetical protein